MSAIVHIFPLNEQADIEGIIGEKVGDRLPEGAVDAVLHRMDPGNHRRDLFLIETVAQLPDDPRILPRDRDDQADQGLEIGTRQGQAIEADARRRAFDPIYRIVQSVGQAKQVGLVDRSVRLLVHFVDDGVYPRIGIRIRSPEPGQSHGWG